MKYLTGIRVLAEQSTDFTPGEGFRAVDAGENSPNPPRGSSLVKILSRKIERPIRTSEDNQCITMLIEIRSIKAYTMFDTGSTSDSLSPDFTRVAGMKVFVLEKPLNVQLGTVGVAPRSILELLPV